MYTNEKGTQLGALMSSNRKELRPLSTEPGYVNFHGTEEEYQEYIQKVSELPPNRTSQIEDEVGNLTQQLSHLQNIVQELRRSLIRQGLEVPLDMSIEIRGQGYAQ